MSIKDVLEICGAVIASLGGGGLIVFGLSGYLGKVWADRGLQNLRQEHAKLNLEFQHQLDLVSRRTQMELDAVAHLRKLKMESEFEKLRELWKRIAALREAFWAIPKAGGFIGPADPEEQKAHWKRMSCAFIERYNDAIQFLNEETLSIPKNIADESYALFKIAQSEAARAALYPHPFGDAMAMFGDKGFRE